MLVCQSSLDYFDGPLDNLSKQLFRALSQASLGVHAGDRVAIVTYGRDPHIALRFTGDRKAIGKGIERAVSADQPYDNIVVSSEAVAIEYAVRTIGEVEHDDPNARANRRRLIILISNIFGVGAGYADEPVIRRLWDRNITLSVIENSQRGAATTTVQRTGGGDSQTILFRRYNPIHIAQATGGGRIVALDHQNPGDLLTPVRQRYTLWFNQPSDAKPGESRTIKIDLSAAARSRFRAATIRAREGYVAR